MKIYILEYSVDRFNILKDIFKDEDVTVVNDEFKHFLDNYDIECIVSPANSFGLMDGGYDAAISKYFGNNLQKDVQKYIVDNYYGEQPVGSSFIIKIAGTNKYLIHTPTMRTPMAIKDSLVVYQCMRTTLMEAYNNNIKSIVIPMFGGKTGALDPEIISKMMLLGYKQVINRPIEVNWNYAIESDPIKKLIKK